MECHKSKFDILTKLNRPEFNLNDLKDFSEKIGLTRELDENFTFNTVLEKNQEIINSAYCSVSKIAFGRHNVACTLDDHNSTLNDLKFEFNKTDSNKNDIDSALIVRNMPSIMNTIENLGSSIETLLLSPYNVQVKNKLLTIKAKIEICTEFLEILKEFQVNFVSLKELYSGQSSNTVLNDNHSEYSK